MLHWIDKTGRQRLLMTACKIKLLYLFLACANILVWTWAWLSLGGESALLGTALLAYSFGLRHALDADHIAAIDNVTRRLMQGGERPVLLGFFFALGHSLVVILASLLIAFAAKSAASYSPQIQQIGGLVSTLISTIFLTAIGSSTCGCSRTFTAVSRKYDAASILPPKSVSIAIIMVACFPVCTNHFSATSKGAGRCCRSDFCSGWGLKLRPKWHC